MGGLAAIEHICRAITASEHAAWEMEMAATHIKGTAKQRLLRSANLLRAEARKGLRINERIEAHFRKAEMRDFDDQFYSISDVFIDAEELPAKRNRQPLEETPPTWDNIVRSLEGD